VIADCEILAQGIHGAAIGSGYADDAVSHVGAIRIDSGDIRAFGGDDSAGIGAGYAYNGLCDVGEIAIHGGSVLALAGRRGAGIGAGHGDHGTSTVQRITISGGSVIATSNAEGAGIGTAVGQAGNSTVGTITITGGTITANGYQGAGIGSGYGEFGNSTIGVVLISGGNITAVGNDAAGIGAGYARDGNSTVRTLTISGNAEGFALSLGNGAGIGAGFGFHGTSSLTTLTLGGAARFRAVADLDAAGIGAANGWLGQSLVHNIVVDGGHYEAFGNHGAGVGAGYDRVGNSTVDSLIVRNGIVHASGVIGIGSDPWGQVKSLEIDGTQGGAVELECYSSSAFCLNASVIVARDAWLVAHTNTSAFIDPVWHTGSSFDSLHITGFYTVPSKRDSFGQARVIHFGKLGGLTAGSNIRRLTKQGTTYSRQAAFNGSHVVGVILSLDQAESYTATLPTASSDTELCLDGKTEKVFSVGNGETFIAHAAPCGSVPSQKAGLTGGAIAGISIGVIAGVAGIAAAILLVLKGIIKCPPGGGGTGGDLIDSKADGPYTTDGI
jgi:hypothetical protein